MLLRIDPSSAEPLYVQLATAVRSGVSRGDVAPGDRLPPARELAASLNLNMHTVLKAYQELRDEGVIELRRGRGAVVSATALDDVRLRAAITALVTESRSLGLSAHATLSLVKDALS